MKHKPIKKALLIYKKSAYSIYFMERKVRFTKGDKAGLTKEIRRFKKAHDEHYDALNHVEGVLRRYGINYDKKFRGGPINYSRYDCVLAIGGDGTFLEASRNVRDQLIIGINSAPSYSVGKLCIGNTTNFEAIARHLSQGTFRVSSWPRLRLDLQGYARPIDCINDILVAHENPAAVSRYYLHIGRVKEEQRGSGMWVATPSGSTGAISSAGGEAMDVRQKRIQYIPRELYKGFNPKYRLKGGVLRPGQGLSVVSLMRTGMIFVDGTHFQLKFPFNAVLKVSLSPAPLRTMALVNAKKERRAR